jgi:hypothetical protein
MGEFVNPFGSVLDVLHADANSRPDAGALPDELPPGGLDWSAGAEGGMLEDPTMRAMTEMALGTMVGVVVGKGILAGLPARALAPIIPRSVGAAESAFSVALKGGRHSGFLRGAERMSVSQLQRAERSFQGQIELHEAKIANPGAYVNEWGSLDVREQEGLLRHWGKEIGNFSDQQSIVQELLRR